MSKYFWHLSDSFRALGSSFRGCVLFLGYERSIILSFGIHGFSKEENPCETKLFVTMPWHSIRPFRLIIVNNVTINFKLFRAQGNCYFLVGLNEYLRFNPEQKEFGGTNFLAAIVLKKTRCCKSL